MTIDISLAEDNPLTIDQVLDLVSAHYPDVEDLGVDRGNTDEDIVKIFRNEDDDPDEHTVRDAVIDLLGSARQLKLEAEGDDS